VGSSYSLVSPQSRSVLYYNTPGYMYSIMLYPRFLGICRLYITRILIHLDAPRGLHNCLKQVRREHSYSSVSDFDQSDDGWETSEASLLL
jgi:hypothetical protein